MRIEGTEEIVPDLDGTITRSNNLDVYVFDCKMCNTTNLLSKECAVKHINGATHKKKLKRQKDRIYGLVSSSPSQQKIKNSKKKLRNQQLVINVPGVNRR